MNSASVDVRGLGDEIARLRRDGYGVVCMYATEAGDMPRSIQTVLRKDAEVLHIETILESDSYPSLSSAVPALLPYEIEMREMNGLDPVGLRDCGPQRMMWAYEDGHPLQKGPLPEERVPVPIPGNNISGEGVFEIPVGPVHAGVIEPGHFRFSVAGEPILKMKAHLGYAHRGIERLMEGDASADRTRMAERISGDSPVANSLAYAHAMEGDADVPERARLLRTVFAELERIHCHFSDIGGLAQDTGFTVPAATGAGLREKMMRLNEYIGGHRYLMGTVVPGGVRRDISDDSTKAIEKRMLKVNFDIEDLMHMLTGSVFFMDRAETTGVLTEAKAVALRAVGPPARAAGVKTDVRKERPYDAYGDVGMRVLTMDKGDVCSRMYVKAGEIVESVSMINQCLDMMKPGPLRYEVRPEEGFSAGIVEAPRGEMMHAVNIVDGKIWRYKIRDPSFVNWAALETALPGNIVPDFPLINKSFNLSYSGNDL